MTTSSPDSSDNNRNKTAMVIFSLERAVGEYVKSQHSDSSAITSTGTYKKISQRDSSVNASSGRVAVVRAVAASYFDEVISLAVECSKDSGEHESFKNLQMLANALGLPDVRNAVSHPNRPFADCFWYRVAAIASDPCIDKIGLLSVKLALQAAEEGRITLPPDDWFDIPYAAVRNNLPRHFEHDGTGLVGRQKEKRELMTAISSGRYPQIAVVGPGGLGKTSLVLDALNDFSLDPSTQDWCDAVVFVSLKQEKLTTDGIIPLTASQTIEELTEELLGELELLFPDLECNNFASIALELAQLRILLCIDNLETLLSVKPEEFTIFFESLPMCWRVLITSRVTVDGAKTLTIGRLGDEGAKSLTYRYTTSKGLEPPNEKAATSIITSSRGNPLALRLMIDRYANGYALAQSASTTEKDIVAFSYKNLVETLSDNALMILEALFVKAEFVRGELVELLGVGSDDAADAIRQLTRTSLVSRSADGSNEVFALSPSVRDLLRDHPRNINIRQKVKLRIADQAKTVRQHKSIQSQYGFSQYSEDYIPDNCPPSLGAALVSAIKVLRAKTYSHSQIIASLGRLTETVKNYPDSAQARIALGRLCLKANDDLEAESHFKHAITLDPNSPVARIVLCSHLLKRERPEDALPLSKKLLDDGWGQESKADEFTARRIWGLHFWALTEIGDLDQIINQTASASDPTWFKDILGCAKAKALISRAAPLHSEATAEAFEGLLAATRILRHPVEPGKTLWNNWSRAVRYLTKELYHYFEVTKPESLTLCGERKFVEDILGIITETYEHQPISTIREEAEPIIRILYDISNKSERELFNNNWIKSQLGQRAFQSNKLNALQKEGYVILTVYKVPFTSENVADYIFAEDAAGKRYWIPRGNVVNFDFVAWAQLRTGSKLAGRDFKSLTGSRGRDVYPIPQEAMLIL